MDSGADAGLLQMFHQAFAMAGSHHVQVIHRPRPRRFIGRDHGIARSLQLPVVLCRTLPAQRIPLCQMRQLYLQQPCLNRIQAPVVAFHVVVVLGGLAMVAQHLHGLGDGGIVGRGRARFPAGSQILSGIKTECGGAPHRARLHPAIALAGEIFRAVPLAGVFDHHQAIAIG